MPAHLLSLPTFHKAFIAIVLAVGIYMLVVQNGIREPFNTRKNFKVIRGSDVYDPMYVDMYDSLVVRKERLDFEVKEIVSRTHATSGSKILDIGSGTGHRCGLLHELGLDCTGFDKSPAMIARASEEYPDIQFVQGDAGASNHNYYSKFTQVLCMYFTFYEIGDQRQFFNNCSHWLRPGGHLVVHLVNPEELDPILPVGNVLINVNPQDYAENKITTTRAVFENKDYKSQFKPKGKDRYTFVETIRDRQSGGVRRNERDLITPPTEQIVALAKKSGLILVDSQEMDKCGYEGQYLFTFQKPS